MYSSVPSYAKSSRVVSRAITAENPSGEPGEGGKASSRLGPGRKGSPCIDLQPGESVILADIEGTGVLRHFWFTVAREAGGEPFVLRNLVLRMYWDEANTPAVEVPLGDFFGCGFGETATYSSAVMVVAPTAGMNCYFPMPFRSRARVEIHSDHDSVVPGFFYQIDYTLGDELTPEDMYFHASWSRSNGDNELGVDCTLASITGGAGSYVGTQIFVAQLGRFWYGEGEVKFYIDDDRQYPTIAGTGLEDYVGGAWAFQDKMGGETPPSAQVFDSLYSGYHQQVRDSRPAGTPYVGDMPISHGMYRWHLLDPVRFRERVRVTLQQIGDRGGHLFERRDDISAVTYWYQVTPESCGDRLPQKELREPR
ncbi:glycoside hydrolase family 172 protein [Schaalia sp. JY-X169]|uniref:glycoside hydrolase family 172 protein n=1 Tax=Schaalia sp. JY-X169 TaxID=2758572 RepID=UPI0015F37517|nr:glycoside hydrolase family 172 protein [Schaalia sp. JY-X169]